MNQAQERALRESLESDEVGRNRTRFNYTGDALRNNGIAPLSIWPESNNNVSQVLSGEVAYDDLPIDELNEYHKGNLWTEQQDIILQNDRKEPLCEAKNMKRCGEESCELFNPTLTPPVCREFKISFKK